MKLPQLALWIVMSAVQYTCIADDFAMLTIRITKIHQFHSSPLAANKKEEMEDLNPSKLTEPVKPGAVVVNNKFNRMTDNKGSSLIYGFTGDPNTNIITTVHTRPQSEGIGYTPTPEDF